MLGLMVFFLVDKEYICILNMYWKILINVLFFKGILINLHLKNVSDLIVRCETSKAFYLCHM